MAPLLGRRWRYFLGVGVGLAATALLLLALQPNPQGGSSRTAVRRSPLSQMKLVRDKRDPVADERLRQIAEVYESRDLQEGHSKIPDGFVPIALQGLGTSRPMVTLCRLNFAEYHRNPARYPMNRLLAALCGREDTIMKSFKSLERAYGMVPSGFVFHMGRCGSTLTANMLAVDPANIVYSESAPPAHTVLHCERCSEEQKISYLRTVILAMGNSLAHSRSFFKFQSANSAHIDIYRKAFPTVPWVFLFRNPVEVLVSQLRMGNQGPCLRHRNNPPPRVAELVAEHRGDSNEDFCAAHLRHLLETPVRLAADETGKGLLVEYHRLPSVFWDTVLPKHFGVTPTPEVLARMKSISQVYSKSKSESARPWSEDSGLKQSQANPEMKSSASTYLSTMYTAMQAASEARLQALSKLPVPTPSPPRRAPEGIAAVHPQQTHNRTHGADLSQKLRVPDVGSAYPQLNDPYFLANIDPVYTPPEASIQSYLPYPQMSTLKALLEEWPPDQPAVPPIPDIAEGSLARFDWRNITQRKQAAVLRWHEIPFMLLHVPEIESTVAKWTAEYLIESFGDVARRVTHSTSNHFMYYNGKRASQMQKLYQAPTDYVTMTFREWYETTLKAEQGPIAKEHFYYQMNVGQKETDWMREDLPIFDKKKSFWLVEPEGNRGINCRFGQRGVIAEAHYDGGRNFVVMYKGAKRYVLLPPTECKLLYLYPRGHPEARHAKADWSNLDWDAYPLMSEARATQVLVRQGEALYIPSYWFHYIISTGFSAQCNSRSGNALRQRGTIADCGFY